MPQYDYIILNPSNRRFDLQKFQANCAKLELDVSKMHCARVGPGLVTKFKHYGTTANRDFVVGVHFNQAVSPAAVHDRLARALAGVDSTMRRKL